MAVTEASPAQRPGVVLIVGASARSMASTALAAEAARLTRMLGVTVTADTPELTQH